MSTTEPIRPAGRWFVVAVGGAVVIVLGLASLAVGCGARGFRSCDVDSDCRDDEICAEPEGSERGGRCARRCESDEDCERTGTTCQPYVDPERDQEEEICLATDTGTTPDGGSRCTSNSDCEDFDAGPAICGINGKCILVDVRRAVRIVDRSPTGESGGDGSEIAAVFLRDDSGDIVGFGDTITWCRADTDGESMDNSSGVDAGDTGGVDAGDAGGADVAPSDTKDADISPRDSSAMDTNSAETSSEAGGTGGPECTVESTIDGSRPELNEDATCIDGPETEATALGEGGGGELLVEFVDVDGDRLELDGSRELVIIEWADQCDPDDTETDRYAVELCSKRSDSGEEWNCESVENNVDGGTFSTRLDPTGSGSN